MFIAGIVQSKHS